MADRSDSYSSWIFTIVYQFLADLEWGIEFFSLKNFKYRPYKAGKIPDRFNSIEFGFLAFFYP